MSDQQLPEPGSVWRRGNEFRVVTDLFGGDICWSGFCDVNGIVSPDEWHAWSADAVQVETETQSGASDE